MCNLCACYEEAQTVYVELVLQSRVCFKEPLSLPPSALAHITVALSGHQASSALTGIRLSILTTNVTSIVPLTTMLGGGLASHLISNNVLIKQFWPKTPPHACFIYSFINSSVNSIIFHRGVTARDQAQRPVTSSYSRIG